MFFPLFFSQRLFPRNSTQYLYMEIFFFYFLRICLVLFLIHCSYLQEYIYLLCFISREIKLSCVYILTKYIHLSQATMRLRPFSAFFFYYFFFYVWNITHFIEIWFFYFFSVSLTRIVIYHLFLSLSLYFCNCVSSSLVLGGLPDTSLLPRLIPCYIFGVLFYTFSDLICTNIFEGRR